MAPRVSAVETSQTLGRGLRILEILAEAPEGRTVSELAMELEVGRAVVYRLVATLEEHRYVRRDGEGRARLALGVLRLGRAVHPMMRAAAVPALRRLAEAVGLTASLSILDGSDVLAVAVVEPTWTDFHVAYREGTRHSRERGAAGRAIGSTSPWVVSTGELQPGAYGLAAPLPGTGLDASVGVIGLAAIDVDQVGPQVVAAAASIAAALTSGSVR
ncbi:MAG TPA: helix-turn-helix domain-containing protein [Candidatus Limnocylindria bacterium]|nr:helix-turn-helix domain-containing protein [Candidatus Limnocylindria bacterium]